MQEEQKGWYIFLFFSFFFLIFTFFILFSLGTVFSFGIVIIKNKGKWRVNVERFAIGHKNGTNIPFSFFL
jgi:uncharacterized membrane protein